jgi:hypothetical protein
MSFAPKELQEEREAQAEAQKAALFASLKRGGAGCLFVAILALCFLFYIAGRVSEMTTPTHVSTP